MIFDLGVGMDGDMENAQFQSNFKFYKFIVCGVQTSFYVREKARMSIIIASYICNPKKLCSL